MRLVRILLVVLAVVAVGLAGWALGARDTYDAPATADPAPAASAPPEPAVTTPAATPENRAAPDPAAPDPATPDPTTRPAPPRPRIFGFGSEPVLSEDGRLWQLPPGSGEAFLITDAEHATRVEFLLTPAGTGTAGKAVSLGVDTTDPYTATWRWKDQPLRAHLTVRATGPGGTTEKVVNVYHPDPTEQP
jgi:hypothetical protein